MNAEYVARIAEEIYRTMSISLPRKSGGRDQKSRPPIISFGGHILMDLDEFIAITKETTATLEENGKTIRIKYKPGEITPEFEMSVRRDPDDKSPFKPEVLATMISKVVDWWDLQEKVKDTLNPDGTQKMRMVPLTYDRLLSVPITILVQTMSAVNKDMNTSPEAATDSSSSSSPAADGASAQPGIPS